MSKLKFFKTGAAAIIMFNTIALTAVFYSIPTMNIAAIITYVIFTPVITIAAYRKNGNLPLSALYAFFSGIIVLLAGNVARIPIGFLVEPMLEYPMRENVLADITLYFAYISIVLVISFAVSRLAGNFLNDRMRLFDDYLRRKLAIYILGIAVIVLAIFFINTFLHDIITDTTLLITVYAVSFIMCFGFLVLAVFAFTDSLYTKTEIRRKNEQLQNLYEYTESVESMTIEVRKFRHDHRNLMLGFRNHINNSDINSLREYFEKYMLLFSESTDVANLRLDKLGDIKPSELKSILSLKFLYAQQLGIDVHIEVPETIENIDNDNLIDICRIAGILLDNAIEGCQDTEQPVLRFIALQRKSDTLFVFTNTYFNEPQLSRIFDKGFTTKEGRRGLGLFTVSQLLADNKNLALNTCIDGGMFIQELSVLTEMDRGELSA